MGKRDTGKARTIKKIDERSPAGAPAGSLAESVVVGRVEQNLNYLIEAHGAHLKYDGERIPTGKEGRAKAFAKICDVGLTTVRQALGGSTKSRIRDKTATSFVKPFSEAVRGIDGSWLGYEHEEFVQKCRDAGTMDSIRIDIPDYRKSVASLHDSVCGIYVAYRYSFHGLDDEEIAREVLHVWIDRSGEMRFSMSFWADGSRPGQQPLAFKGHVLPIGQTLFFVGLSESRHIAERGRSLFVHNERGLVRMDRCKLGLLTSTRLHVDPGPCVASTLLVRLDWQPRDLSAFVREVTYIGPTTPVIESDFGLQHEDWIRAFMDNRPRGAVRERKLLEMDGNPLHRDPVLRVNSNRFSERMPDILTDVIKTEKVFAPFKPNWVQRPDSNRSPD